MALGTDTPSTGGDARAYIVWMTILEKLVIGPA
jgi:hypothetical protein